MSTKASFGLLNYDGSWSQTAETFVQLGDRLSSATTISRITNLPEGMFGVHLEGAGNALWGEGEICGTAVDENVTWIP